MAFRCTLFRAIIMLFSVRTNALSLPALSRSRSSPPNIVMRSDDFSPAIPGAQDGILRQETRGIDRRKLLFTVLSGGASLLRVPGASAADEAPKKLTFQTLDSGVQVADIIVGKDSQSSVTPNSKVNIHILGRLLGKQGWIFEDSQAAGEDPFRLDFGTGTVVTGLEEGLQGMRVGGRRRIVIPSAVGYTSRQLEPIPRDFGNRQRLYTTVMNNVRIDREREALGADLAGVVVLDVELLRFRN